MLFDNEPMLIVTTAGIVDAAANICVVPAEVATRVIIVNLVYDVV